MCQLKQFPSCKLEVRPRDDFPDYCVAVVTVIYVQGYIKQRRVGNGQSECFFSPLQTSQGKSVTSYFH